MLFNVIEYGVVLDSIRLSVVRPF